MLPAARERHPHLLLLPDTGQHDCGDMLWILFPESKNYYHCVVRQSSSVHGGLQSRGRAHAGPHTSTLTAQEAAKK